MNSVPMLDRSEMERLLSILEHSSRVRRRQDFFVYVQGIVQGLMPHDILICALGDFDRRSYRIDCFSSQPVKDSLMAELCRKDGGLLQELIQSWRAGGQMPLLLDENSATVRAEPALAGHLRRASLGAVAVHGVSNITGEASSFFGFVRAQTPLRARDPYMLELIVPHMHVAWLRVNMEGARKAPASLPFSDNILTQREMEILEWVRQGKSNIEIGAILGLSPLTVKNHMQKLLRKLNVQNRAQAVARGISLGIL